MRAGDDSSLPPRVLLSVNSVAAVVSGAFGVLAVASPSTLTGGVGDADELTSFFVEMYAVRAVVLAGAVVATPAVAHRAPCAASPIFLTAGVLQIGDAVIAVVHRTSGTAGALLAASVHCTTALVLKRFARTRPWRQ